MNISPSDIVVVVQVMITGRVSNHSLMSRKFYILRDIITVLGEIMSLLDLFRQQYVKGEVVGKYRLNNNNIGLIVEDAKAHKRYHVEFKDYGDTPGIDNLFGLLKNTFDGKSEQVDQLINKGDVVELTLSYSKGPFRQAYYLHSAYSPAAYKASQSPLKLSYNLGKTYW